MKRRLAPDSLTLGASLHNLGEALLGQGRLVEARACFREALELRGRLAPGSGDVATDWHSLGLVDREQGRTEAALAKWRTALDLMDAQRGKLAVGDRAGFTARYAIIYQDTIEALVGLGRPAEAFAVRERMHARAMLSLLGQRDQAPAEPRPLDLARARAALDPGVTLVAFAVLRHATAAFVVRGPGVAGPAVSVFVIPLDGGALRDRVVAFRGLIERGRSAPEIEPALAAQGERLFADLLAPAGRALDDAERVLISPDGALHLLPFGALVSRREPLRFLAEWKPLPTVASASVYAEIKKSRRAAPDPAPVLAAFGDPALSASPGGEASRGGRDALRPLPYSREEVDRIAALFGAGAQRYLGAAATKKQALAIGRQVRYVHFATHGLLDARSPLDSALVLAPPAPGETGDGGLLRAWEVRDRLRLDADLVALSACESGLGREAAAEGLIGLARAFQHAGARSVLASLWAIPDRSTARLMESFYQRVRQGAPRDRALQDAQLASRRQGEHPYHWAAFQLSGDWR
jgi:CHAT domain-containing protein